MGNDVIRIPYCTVSVTVPVSVVDPDVPVIVMV
jgi:hypothetical protein